MAHLGLMAAAGSIVYFVVCCFALLRGGPPERLVAVFMLVNFIAVPLLFNRHDVRSNLTLLILGDALILLVILACLFQWRRIWLVFGAASQALSILVTWATLLELKISGWVYESTDIVANYGLLLALVVAVMLRMVRAR